MSAAIMELFRPFSVSGVLLAAWILVMISVPVIRWVAGEGAERIGITAGVLAQVATVMSLLFAELGWVALLVLFAVPFIGWASEAIGSHTGFPFGSYMYTDVLQPQIADVPILIPFAWLMMMPPAWAVGLLIAPNSPVLTWLIAALAFTSWDLYLDPQMVHWQFWKWKKHGAYQGIPLSNYVGWVAVSFVITGVVDLAGRLLGIRILALLPVQPLALVFVITWALQFVGQFFFWKLRVSAVTGAIVMGTFAVLSLILGS